VLVDEQAQDRLTAFQAFDLYLAVSKLDTEATNLQLIYGADDANACEGRSVFWAIQNPGPAIQPELLTTRADLQTRPF
jgi:hypothetical protein